MQNGLLTTETAESHAAILLGWKFLRRKSKNIFIDKTAFFYMILQESFSTFTEKMTK